VIFGEDEGDNALPSAPPSPNAGGFQSPLEMQ
jgi:hypothetical protein